MAGTNTPAAAAHTPDHGHDAAHDHPGELVYIKIAAILAAVTAIEVIIYYIDALEDILVPALLLLSAGKFIAVVGYFMHLKFDDRRLAYIFIAALLLTLSVVLALDVLFNTNVIDYSTDFLVAEH